MSPYPQHAETATVLCPPTPVSHGFCGGSSETTLLPPEHVQQVLGKAQGSAQQPPATVYAEKTPAVPTAETAHPLPVGYTFPSPYQKHQVVKCLGCGAFGITYLVKDTVLDRLLVVKECLPKSYALRGEDGETVIPFNGCESTFAYLREVFLKEAKAMAALKHPHIVDIKSFIEHTNGTDYYVMDFVEGCTAEGAKVQNIQTLAEKLLETLHYLHGKGRLHVDIKPANIMLKQDGTPVLIDFGSSVEIGKPAVAYTPDYAAPELAATKKPSISSDLYALGRTLLNMAGAGELPPVLRRLAERAVQPRPQDRPQTAQEWLSALKNTALVSPCKLLVTGDKGYTAATADKNAFARQLQQGTNLLHLVTTAWEPSDTARCRRMLESLTTAPVRLLVYHVPLLDAEHLAYAAETAAAIDNMEAAGHPLPREMAAVSLITVQQVQPQQHMMQDLQECWLGKGEKSAPMPNLLQQAADRAADLISTKRQQWEKEWQKKLNNCPTPHAVKACWETFSTEACPTPDLNVAGQELQEAAKVKAWAADTFHPKKDALALLNSLKDAVQKAIARHQKAAEQQPLNGNFLEQRCTEWDKRGLLACFFHCKEKALLRHQKKETGELLQQLCQAKERECLTRLLKTYLLPALEKEAADTQDIIAEIERVLKPHTDATATPKKPWIIEQEGEQRPTVLQWFPEYQTDGHDFNTVSNLLQQAVMKAPEQQGRGLEAPLPFKALKAKVSERKAAFNGRLVLLGEERFFAEVSRLHRSILPAAEFTTLAAPPHTGLRLLHLLDAATEKETYLRICQPLTEKS